MYIVDRFEDDFNEGSLRHAANSGATDIKFTIPEVNLIAPVEFPSGSNVSLYGCSENNATTILNYGLIFTRCEYAAVNGLTFRNYAGDGVQFYTTKVGKVKNCFFLDAKYTGDDTTSADEAISVVKGCKNIEIAFCGFKNVHKCILLGTGDGTDYILDKETIVSIHENIFYADCERRYPYGTGKIAFSGNWILGWKYQGVQSFASRFRQSAKAMLYNNIYEQTNPKTDGFPMNQLNSGGADQAVTLEGDAKVLLAGTNTFNPSSWLIRKNTGPNPLFTTDEMNQMVWYQGDVSSLKQHLLDSVGPKPV